MLKGAEVVPGWRLHTGTAICRPIPHIPSPRRSLMKPPSPQSEPLHIWCHLSSQLEDLQLPGVLDQPEVLARVRGPVADHRDGVVLGPGVAAGEDSSPVVLERSGAGHSGYHGSKLGHEFLQNSLIPVVCVMGIDNLARMKNHDISLLFFYYFCSLEVRIYRGTRQFGAPVEVGISVLVCQFQPGVLDQS